MDHLAIITFMWVSQVVLVVKNPPANAGDIRDVGSVPGWGTSPGGGHGNTLWYSCLENPMDRGAWRAMVHRVAKSWTRLKWFSMHPLSCSSKVIRCFAVIGINLCHSHFKDKSNISHDPMKAVENIL